MSEYTIMEVEIDDEEALMESLKEMGMTPYKHEIPVSYKDYRGSTRAKVDVTVDTRYGKVGFEKVGGKYKIHSDSSGRIDTGLLTQLHSKHKVRKAVKRKSSKYRLVKEDVDAQGNIRMKVRVRSF